MILGSSFWGALSDTRGRRPAFLFTALGSAAFAYLSAAAPNFWVGTQYAMSGKRTVEIYPIGSLVIPIPWIPCHLHPHFC